MHGQGVPTMSKVETLIKLICEQLNEQRSVNLSTGGDKILIF